MDLPQPIPLRTDYSLTRESPFSYRCHGCNRCCHDKAIPVNPYEVARLAETLGTTTSDVLAHSTTTGGATLATQADGACVFLGANGCTVHAGRPLACRLYPLGRQVAGAGRERFAEVVPHPESEGVYGQGNTSGDSTVEGWLRSQGAGPFLAAADRYSAVLSRMIAALTKSQLTEDVLDETAPSFGRPAPPPDENWLDMDAVVARRCAALGEPVPSDVESKTEIHLAALEEWAAHFGA